MRPVDALIAEIMADLIHALESADDQPFEIQLIGDAQIQRHIERVVVRDERTRRSAPVQRLQHRRFDFEIVQPVEMRANAARKHRAGAKKRTHFGMHRQIGVALTRTLLGVRESRVAHHLSVDHLLLAER